MQTATIEQPLYPGEVTEPEETASPKVQKPSAAAHLLRQLKRVGQHRGALGLLFQSRMEVLIRAVELENEAENHRLRAAQFGVIFREYREITRIIQDWEHSDNWNKRVHPSSPFINALSSEENPELFDLKGYYTGNLSAEAAEKADGTAAGTNVEPPDETGTVPAGIRADEDPEFAGLPPRWRTALSSAPRAVRRRVKRLLEKNRRHPGGRCHREIEVLLGPPA